LCRLRSRNPCFCFIVIVADPLECGICRLQYAVVIRRDSLSGVLGCGAMSKLLFSSIEVTRQAFYRTAQSYAIVNLKPIVPGHVLVIPTRPVPRLADLTPAEIASLFTSVQTVGNVVEKAYSADALTVACQDGKAAGQSIPHVHVHIIPRRFTGDQFEERNDDIYPALEEAEAHLPDDVKASARATSEKEREDAVQRLRIDADDARPPRSIEEMVKEAEWLSGLFEKME